MMIKGGNRHRSSTKVWIFLLFFAVLLLLIKFFFVGTFYVVDERILPGHVASNSLLIVSIQSAPSTEGDIILLELDSGEIVPALFISHLDTLYTVKVGDEIKKVEVNRAKGKVVSSIQL